MESIIAVAPKLRKLKLLEKPRSYRRKCHARRAWNDARSWYRSLLRLDALEDLALRTAAAFIHYPTAAAERQIVLRWVAKRLNVPSSDRLACAHPTLSFIRIWYRSGDPSRFLRQMDRPVCDYSPTSSLQALAAVAQHASGDSSPDNSSPTMYSPNIYSPDTSLPGTPATTVAIPSVAGSLLLSVEPPDDDKWRGHDSDFAPIQGTSTVFPVDLLPSIEAAAPTLRQLPDSRFDSRYTRRTEAPSTSRRRASNRLISGLQVCTISLYASVMERLNVVHKDSVSAFQETLRLARSNETHNVRDAKADDEIATRLAEIFDVLKAINNTMSRMYVLEGAKTNRFRMPQNFVGSTIGRVHMTEASHRQHMVIYRWALHVHGARLRLGRERSRRFRANHPSAVAVAGSDSTGLRCDTPGYLMGDLPSSPSSSQAVAADPSLLQGQLPDLGGSRQAVKQKFNLLSKLVIEFVRASNPSIIDGPQDVPTGEKTPEPGRAIHLVL
ncbi:hypothetical protein L226DRAFT_527732 [Lentinus tigrinus ALCF2SS1-7]|uniref:uncharacterized protein n=1 Tax=Lentinus tigrinus ALCF2SS1-7 TaxID=1328758 RepID=UPI00116635B4|nr:hypothetical protein L226DRAFT_527732 [Lentinus tigrinus ALCF2SS1-7]